MENEKILKEIWIAHVSPYKSFDDFKEEQQELNKKEEKSPMKVEDILLDVKSICNSFNSSQNKDKRS